MSDCFQQRNAGAGLLPEHGRTCRATDKMPNDTHGRRAICGREVVGHVHAGFRCGNFCKRHCKRMATNPGALRSKPVFFAEEND